MLGLGYPGGPIIEKLAISGDEKKVKFTIPKISDGRPDFSFSGLKTAVARYVRENPVDTNSSASRYLSDLAASFQHTVVKMLASTMENAAKELRPKILIVAGGVACNQVLIRAAKTTGEKLSLPVYFPSKHLSTDNAAMIAAAGYRHLKRGEKSGPNMTADISMRLQNFENEDAELKRKRVRYRL